MTEQLDQIRVIIVDDHPMMRRGLTDLFYKTEDIKVVAVASDGIEAISLTNREHPDIVLMDLSMPNMDGMTATKFLLQSCPDARVVILTSFGGNDRVKEALNAGAVGYLLKDAPADDILKGVRAAAKHSLRTSDT